MGDTVYNFLAPTIDLLYWSGELHGAENLPAQGPAVLVSNHLGPLGPIGVLCSTPLRLYPWIISHMIDKEEAAEYICMDFVEKTLHLPPPFSMLFARQLVKITVPLLSEIGCIPVYRRSDKIAITWEQSLARLLAGGCLYISPEYDQAEIDPLTQMRPFMTGFVRLGERYYRAAQRALAFYPVAVHESHQVMVGEPVRYDPLNALGRERRRVAGLLYNSIKTMYLHMAGYPPAEPVTLWQRFGIGRRS